MIGNYSKIWHLDHEEVKLMKGEIVAQEKVDGSQFSFSLNNKELFARSRRVSINLLDPPQLFEKAIAYLLKIKEKLVEGYIYRGEVLNDIKHNALVYGRVPNNNIVIFDIEPNLGNFFMYEEMKEEAENIDLEVVPQLMIYQNINQAKSDVERLLQIESFLGGVLVEGTVLKPRRPEDAVIGRFQKTIMAKFVSEVFKEVNKKNWNEEHPKTNDINTLIVETVSNPARWEKAIQRLKETDQFTGTLKDIGLLIPEVKKDVEEECEEIIKDMLYKFHMREIRRKLTHGLPEWYKRRL